MNSQIELSFKDICKSIIYKSKYKDLKNIKHHGLNRYIHILRVSKYTYKISKFLHMDYVSATRAALLHDYFLENSSKDRKMLSKHPNIACANAINDYGLNEIEINAIESHMFPLGKSIPKFKESWLLTIVDKVVAIYEMFKFKLNNTIYLYLLFFINMIFI